MSKIGVLIKGRRIFLGCSQMRIAKHLGHTSPQFISNIERGLCGCPIPMAKRIAKFLVIGRYEFLTAMWSDFFDNFNKKWKPETIFPRRKSVTKRKQIKRQKRAKRIRKSRNLWNQSKAKKTGLDFDQRERLKKK